MITREVFNQLVSDAYHHLYDLATLRHHALTGLLVSEAEQTGKEKAWKMHTLLVDTIEELNPGPQVPVSSSEWRRYRLLQLRFIEGADPQAVADGLFISRRHFYRELPQALEACAEILWNRLFPGGPAADETSHPDPAAFALDQLREEAVKFQSDCLSTDTNEVLQSLAPMLDEPLAARGIQIEWNLNNSLPPVQINGGILRQIFLGLMNFLLAGAATPRIEVVTAHSASAVLLTVIVQSPGGQDWLGCTTQALTQVQELASLNGASLDWGEKPAGQIHFLIKLPTMEQRPIVIADDNPDIRRLIGSMLAGHYRAIEAANGLEAVRLAQEVQPCAILLDLMMPESDGWEALQRLKNGEATAAIPVVIFSVLGMRDLALSLGAAAFLEKPVSEKALMEVLGRLVNQNEPVH